MELFQLVYAVTLARYRNFSRAAEKLFITQPTLSQQIQKLEKEISFPIFVRNSKSVTVTLPGEKFLEQANQVIHEYEQLQKITQELSSDLNGEITFGSSVLSSPHISDEISAFLEMYPHIKFHYIETWDPDLLELLRRGEIDVGLICLQHDMDDKSNLEIWPIRDEHICAVVAQEHPLAKKSSVTLLELAKERLVFTSPGSGLRQLMLKMFEAEGTKPSAIMELISLEARLSLVRSGAVTFVMNEQFNLYKQETLAVIPIEPKIYRTFALVTTKEKSKSSAVSSFIDLGLKGINNRLKGAVKL